MKILVSCNCTHRLSAAIVVVSLLAAPSPSLAKGSLSSSKNTSFSAANRLTSSSPSKWTVLPLVVVGGEGKEAKQYQSAFEAEVVKSGIDRANPKQVSSFLAQESGCIRKDECLGRLARAVRAERVLLVTISPFSKEIVLTAKIV